MTGCSVLRTGPVLVANEVHTEAGGSTDQLLCRPAETLPGIIPAAGGLRPVAELRLETPEP